VEKVLGGKLRVEEGARRAGDAVQLVADPSRIRDRLGWRPRIGDLAVLCATAYKWEAVLRTPQAGKNVLRTG
jgi:UDP-glucose 4-epimerase